MYHILPVFFHVTKNIVSDLYKKKLSYITCVQCTLDEDKVQLAGAGNQQQLPDGLPMVGNQTKMYLENIIQTIYDGKLNSISYSLELNIRFIIYCSLLHLKSNITGHHYEEHFQTLNAHKLSTRCILLVASVSFSQCHLWQYCTITVICFQLQEKQNSLYITLK